MLRVAALVSDASGCGHYRILSPLRVLAQQGLIEFTAPMARVRGGKCSAVVDLAKSQEPLPGSMGMLPDVAARSADVVILQRTATENIFPLVEELGARCVYECDDDLETINPRNPCRAETSEEDFQRRTALSREIASRCRLITATTKPLASRLSRWNPQVRVVPNGIDLHAWEWRAPTTDRTKVRIGWLSSRNHVEDEPLLRSPLRAVFRRHESVRFVLAGAFYPGLKRETGRRCEFFGGVPIQHYPACAREMQLDIGVAPLLDQPFADGKSPIKWLEYTALGCPTVASASGPYRDFIRHGVTGYLCSGRREWQAALDELITNPDRRRELALAALQEVRERHTVEHSAAAWWDVLREVAS